MMAAISEKGKLVAIAKRELNGLETKKSKVTTKLFDKHVVSHQVIVSVENNEILSR